MAGPNPQPWQQALADNPPSPSGNPTAVSPGQLRQHENAQRVTPPPAPAPPPIPTDPKGFQQYLNNRGAKPPLKVDGIIGPKTLAAARTLGVTVPDNLAPKAPAPVAHPAAAAPPQQSQPAEQITNTATTEPVVHLTADEIKARYGYLGAILDFPDVAQVIGQMAADPAMSDDQFLAALKNTPTWQNHTTNELNWIALKPADQQARADGQKAAIVDQAKQLGITLDADRLNQIATDSLRLGWNGTQLAQAVAAEFHYRPGGQSGTIGQAEVSLKKMANDYLVPVTDATLANWETQIAAGTATPDTFKSYFIDQAAGLYKGIEKQLRGGATVQQLAEPYKQDAANELGVNPDAIDFAQPQWLRALSSTDPTSGQPIMMGRADWIRTLRTDPTYGWDKSQNGIAAGYAVGNTLAQAMGLRP